MDEANKSNVTDWRTQLIHSTANVPQGFNALVPAVYRGSTVVFDSLAKALGAPPAPNYTYGIYGTPTVLELAARIAELEHAKNTIIVPSGQAAFAVVYLAFLRAGSHMLLPKSIYRPARKLAEDFLSAFSVDIELYDPMIGSEIDSLIRPETTMVWCESPGSITMEVQDIRAIAGAARRRNVVVAIDNTYAAGVMLDAFELGVDVSIQSLSKYIGGHSDLLLGSISVVNGSNREKIERSHRMMGISVSPDECSLALRGLTTLGVRLDHLEKATLDVARHLKQRSEISIVLHPALPDCPGHDIWSKEFKGSASVFSIVFEERWEKRHVETFVNALRLFKIGYGWGGSTSLVMAYPNMSTQRHRDSQRLVRLNVGFESVSDLIFDLDAAIAYARP